MRFIYILGAALGFLVALAAKDADAGSRPSSWSKDGPNVVVELYYEAG
jgi:hypothetical protein